MALTHLVLVLVDQCVVYNINKCFLICAFLSLCRLLYSLAFNARFLRHLWHLITSMTTKMITG